MAFELSATLVMRLARDATAYEAAENFGVERSLEAGLSEEEITAKYHPEILLNALAGYNEAVGQAKTEKSVVQQIILQYHAVDKAEAIAQTLETMAATQAKKAEETGLSSPLLVGKGYLTLATQVRAEIKALASVLGRDLGGASPSL